MKAKTEKKTFGNVTWDMNEIKIELNAKCANIRSFLASQLEMK